MASFYGIADGIQAIGGLFASGSNAPVVLGGIDLGALCDMAIPTAIGFGAEQQLNVQALMGGQRAVQVMGEQPDDVTWGGKFDGGATGYTNAMQLAAIRTAGQPTQLVCLDVSVQVIVRSFRWKYIYPQWIEYTITLVVIPPTAASTGASGDAALQSAAQSDTGSAAGILGPISGVVAAVQPPLTLAQSGLAMAANMLRVVGGVTGITALNNLSNTMAGVQSNIAAVDSISETGLNAATALVAGGFTGAGSIAAQATTMVGNAVAFSTSLAAGQQASGFMARAIGNVSNAAPNATANPTPPQPGSVSVLGG